MIELKTNNKIWLCQLIVVGLVLILMNSCKKKEESTNETGKVSDVDGNTYSTVKIGAQWWATENLKTTKFNDGASIPSVKDAAAWFSYTPRYCWYNNDSTKYKVTYGALYNWYTVNTGKLCPIGWHVPTDAEWTTLTTYLGGDTVAGGKLKSTTGWLNNGNGTDDYGFKAYAGGMCWDDGTFHYFGSQGLWWSSTKSSSTDGAWGRGIVVSDKSIYKEDGPNCMGEGFSIRCVKDN
jgi:uncharacterized protein (TIGR02145 family)